MLQRSLVGQITLRNRHGELTLFAEWLRAVTHTHESQSIGCRGVSQISQRDRGHGQRDHLTLA